MNKKLGLAVAGAVLALSSAAQAGIVIPAGDWTIDIGGNVNAYYTNTRFSGDLKSDIKNAPTNRSANNISTGLLPSALGIGGKTRQNDLDVAFQFTFFTGVDSGGPLTSGAGVLAGGNTGGFGSNGAGANSLNIRQAFMTFGDASWGTIKAGRDLGVFGSDAILSDMTLLGVGVGAGGSGNSTLGRIGSGYLYADWVGQIQYQSPNFNGFQFTGALRQPWGNDANSSLGLDGKVSYSWAGDFSGKIWASALTQKTRTAATAINAGNENDNRANAYDVGANVSFGHANLVGYYYTGKNMGLATMAAATQFSGLLIDDPVKSTDVHGGYVQATYVIPTGTKLGASYGVSKNDSNIAGKGTFESKSWIVGAYHPLTKSLNLVAEYTDNKIENNNYNKELDGKAKTVSLGAILFF